MQRRDPGSVTVAPSKNPGAVDLLFKNLLQFLLPVEAPVSNAVNGRPKVLRVAGFNSYSYFLYMKRR
jgi:hypothetical protein